MIQPLVPYGLYGSSLNLVLSYTPKGKGFLCTWLRTKGEQPHIWRQAQAQDAAALRALLAKHPGLPILVYLPAHQPVIAMTPTAGTKALTAAMGVGISDSSAFLWQVLPTQAQENWTAVIRQDILSELEEVLGPAFKQVVYLNFHPATLTYTLPFLPDYEAASSYGLDVGEETFSWQNGLQAQTSAPSLDLPALSTCLSLAEDVLGPLATAVHYSLSKGQDLHGWSVGQQAQQQQVHRLQQWAKGLAIAATMLLLALTAIGLSSWILSSRLEGGQQQLSQQRHILAKIDQQAQRISDLSQQQGLDLDRLQGYPKVSYVLDQVAKELGGEMTLTELWLAPEKEVLKKQGLAPTLAPDLLLVGWTTASYSLGPMLSRIKSLAFVQSAEIAHSSYDFQAQAHRFTLIIQHRPL